MKSMLNKKGQIYLLAALILGFVIYGLSTVVNKFEQQKIEGDFERLSDNYNIESSRLINSLILNNKDVINPFTEFTSLFTAYSKSQNPSFELIYLLEYNNSMQVGNFLSKQVIVYDGNSEYNLSGCFEGVKASINSLGFSFSSNEHLESIRNCTLDLPTSSWVQIKIDNNWYTINITKNKPQIMITATLSAEEQGRVFVGGEGFVKESRDISNYCSKLPYENCSLATDCEWKNSNCRSTCSAGAYKSKRDCETSGYCCWNGTRLENPCDLCPPVGEFCGNGICGLGEGCSTCAADCGLCPISKKVLCERFELRLCTSASNCDSLCKSQGYNLGRASSLCCERESRKSCRANYCGCYKQYYSPCSATPGCESDKIIGTAIEC